MTLTKEDETKIKEIVEESCFKVLVCVIAGIGLIRGILFLIVYFLFPWHY